MAKEIIRQDVIEVNLESNDMLASLNKINDEINRIKKSFGILDDDKPLEKTKEQADKTKESMQNTQKQTEKLKESLEKVGKTSFNKVISGLKKVGTVAVSATKAAAKATVAGIGAASTGVAALVGSSVKAYGDFEQLTGGVETLFGAGGANTVEEYAKNMGKSVSAVQDKYKVLKESEAQVFKDANDAYKTAGLSANDYMETVTGFSASLISSLNGDTKKATEYSNKAIVDMADNANKMGSSMESIQNAYQGFAKQNYTMLDNLKLGYGGTQEEMKRLIKDAAKIDKTVKANDMSFGNIVLAIHAIQDSMDISGTTKKEASTTIQGSFSSLKSAWGNLMTSLVVGGDSFDQCLANLVDSAKTFGNNVMPAIRGALEGVGYLIVGLSPYIEAELPGLIDELLPPLLKAATALIKGLIKALPNIIKTLIKELPDIVKQIGQAITEAFGTQIPSLGKFGKAFMENANIIAKIIPCFLGGIVAFKAIKPIVSGLGKVSSLFGKSDKSIGKMKNPLGNIAKTNVKTILKGMGNIAIIVGGFTVLAAALMFVAPYMAKLSDTKSLIKVVGTITVLGIVGTALAGMASIVGKISVMTVVKGFANMAVMIVGMTAIAAAFMLVSPYMAQLSDVGVMKKVIGTIAVLGIVGGALSIFAGIVGIIPIPVVLAGLANIALVIAGFTAIILAFGELSKIKGFNDFIEKGGNTLANLFEQIGKIGGSLIGGFGEGITNALPKIGENLTGFANSIKPMFTMFKGVNVSGIGSFFTAIGGFMLNMAADGILSIFTGGTDFADLGLQLTAFANNSSGFFTKVSKFPENGFKNATALFKSLSDIGNVPKTGGLVQWFGGETDFSGLAFGLSQLTGQGVSSFYNMVSKLPQEGFEGAKALFQSLADIGNIPNTGGVAQWFSGENDFAGLAEKLPGFGTAMAEFYKAISEINDFSKISGLFKAMKGIGEAFPNTGGIAQWFTGENDISGVGASLKQFGLDTAAFFTQVNTLNISKLNGLWQSIKSAGSIATTNISSIVDKNINTIVAKVSELPKKMGDAMKSSGDSLASALVDVWKKAVTKSAAPVNKLLDGANWILKEFGSSKRVAKWTPYAKGTDGHKGGNALVNDGRGAELVQMPNGNAFIPKGRNVFIPNAPKGMKVLSAEDTANVMGRKSPTFKYATGNIDIWDYLDNAKGLIGKVKEKYVDYNGITGLALNIGKGMVSTISNEMIPWAKKLMDEFGALSLANYNPSGGVEQWRTTVIRALKMEGQYSAANVARTLYQMQTESGGNPKAINNWDSNAKKGTPSKGLMQVIDPTFAAYARPGFNKNIYDPLSNILASIRYAVSRYGSLASAYQGHGYANGGIATKPSIFGEAGDEMAIPLSPNKRNRAIGLWMQTGRILGLMNYTPENSPVSGRSSSQAGNVYNFNMNITVEGGETNRQTARAVKNAAKEALAEFMNDFAGSNKPVREC